MKLDDFVSALEDAGWRNSCDAQHDGIRALHLKLFPVIADLEEALIDSNSALKRMAERLSRKENELSKFREVLDDE